MLPAYPFRGPQAWVLLPTLFMVGGLISGLINWWLQSSGASEFLVFYLVVDMGHFLLLGAALACGPRPLVAFVGAGVLSACSVYGEERLVVELVPGVSFLSTPVWRAVVVGFGTGTEALLQRLYLHARTKGRAWAVAAMPLFPLWVATSWAVPPVLDLGALLPSALSQGLWEWVCLAVAIRVAGRATGPNDPDTVGRSGTSRDES